MNGNAKRIDLAVKCIELCAPNGQRGTAPPPVVRAVRAVVTAALIPLWTGRTPVTSIMEIPDWPVWQFCQNPEGPRVSGAAAGRRDAHLGHGAPPESP